MNKEFTEEKVEKLADLLMIGLTDEEKKMVFYLWIKEEKKGNRR